MQREKLVKPQAIQYAWTMTQVMSQTLEHIDKAPGFNQWMFSQYHPFIRWGKIWEIGSGIGNMSEFLLDTDFLCLSDYEAGYREILNRKYKNKKNIAIEHVDLENLDVAKFKQYGFNTIISTNVLEHIKNHEKAVADITSVMQDDTVLITLVPAHPFLFSKIDENLGHYRRYSRQALKDLLEKSGHEIISLRYFCRLSVAGWLMRKLMGATAISSTDMSVVETILPILKMEKYVPLPFGQSLIAVSQKRKKI